MAPSQEITNWKVWCITKITIKIIKNSFILKFKIIFWQKFYTNYNVSWPLWFEYKVNNSPLLGSKNSRKKKSNPHVFRGFHLMCGISVSKGYFPTTCNENNLFFFFLESVRICGVLLQQYMPDLWAFNTHNSICACLPSDKSLRDLNKIDTVWKKSATFHCQSPAISQGRWVHVQLTVLTTQHLIFH